VTTLNVDKSKHQKW